MNQPFQPAASPNTPADETPPLRADTDPYFSIAMNVPSGPIGESTVSVPSGQTEQPESDAPSGHQNLQLGLDVLREIDVRTLQLEDSGVSEIERPMPIRNSCCIESAIESASASEPTATPQSFEGQEIVSQDESGRFIAKENSVIIIDGDEGFDYIDLSDRDVAHVTFGVASMTVLDATTGESFTIEFQNIKHALFANGQMIKLRS